MDLKLPHLGEGADSGTVVNLFVKEGDQLAKDQAILELENEKAVATIPSTAAGTVTKVFVKPATRSASASVSSPWPRLAQHRKNRSRMPMRQPGEARQALRRRWTDRKRKEPAELEPVGEDPKAGLAPAAAPSIRKLARDLGIDLTRVRGSARGGRIVLEDVRAYIQRLQRLAAQPLAGSAGALLPTAKARAGAD